MGEVGGMGGSNIHTTTAEYFGDGRQQHTHDNS